MNVITASEARATLKQTMDTVCRDHMPTIVTRQRGEPVIMMSLADYNSMQETLYLLSSENNARRLRESVAQLRAGKVTFREVQVDEPESKSQE